MDCKEGASPDIQQHMYQAAALAMAIRQFYCSRGHRGPHRYWTYVLLLQHNCIYVGSTDNPYQRLLDHELQNMWSSAWVRERGPVVRVLELFGASKEDDERYKFLEYCVTHGWESVRGASWCQLVIPEPAPLRTFVRNRCDFEYVPRDVLDGIHSRVRDLANNLNTG